MDIIVLLDLQIDQHIYDKRTYPNQIGFPRTRYQGSKRKILPWIHETLSTISFDSALDVFGGTGAVSYLLKKMGKRVIYNDKLRFNYIIGKSLIENDDTLFLGDEQNWLMKRHHGLTYGNYIASYFEGMYFLDEENEWLDIVNTNLAHLRDSSDERYTYKYALAFNAVCQACLMKRPFNMFHRLNLSIRTSNVRRSFGNKTTWERSFNETFRSVISELNHSVFLGEQRCLSSNLDVFEMNEPDVDLVYLDPPYFRSEGANETSDYLRCYHFLEKMTAYPFFQSTDIPPRDRSWDLNQEKIFRSFLDMLDIFRNQIIVLSYKRGGTPSIDFIVNNLKKRGRSVETRSRRYSYALNRQNGDAARNREVLIIAR